MGGASEPEVSDGFLGAHASGLRSWGGKGEALEELLHRQQKARRFQIRQATEAEEQSLDSREEMAGERGVGEERKKLKRKRRQDERRWGVEERRWGQGWSAFTTSFGDLDS